MGMMSELVMHLFIESTFQLYMLSSPPLLQRWFLGDHGERTIFIALDDDAPDDMKGLCREYTLPQSEQSSRVRRWIRGNTMIGPVPDAKVCYHQGRYDVEIMIESLFRDRTVPWVRSVNGINKYVTETSEEIIVVAKAEPRPKPTFTLSLVYIHDRGRQWLNVETGNSVNVVLKCQSL